MNPTQPTVAEAVERLKTVFVEIPGTQLSLADASRLSGLERTTCRVVLEALEDARLITRSRNGLFIGRSPDSHY
jgi:DNA-binding IclR family transcriptional regulator